MTQRREEDFEELKNKSQISDCSRTSKHSIANSLDLQARAKAEAARVELRRVRRVRTTLEEVLEEEFAQQEAELLKQQAILNASLHELKLQKASGSCKSKS